MFSSVSKGAALSEAPKLNHFDRIKALLDRAGTAPQTESPAGDMRSRIAALQAQTAQVQSQFNGLHETMLPGGAAGDPGAMTTDAGQPLRRLFASDYKAKDETRPSARAISNAVSAADPDLAQDGVSDLFWLWGQFIDHDISLSEHGEGALAIPIPAGDTWFDPDGTGTESLRMRPSEAVMNGYGVAQQVNAITALMDGSQIYGSDAATTASLREGQGGRLSMPEDALPTDERGFYRAGDVRVNENIGLTSMHTVWAREHNRIADVLAAENPDWSDNQLFEAARAQTVAQLQAVTFTEFLPMLLGPDALPAYEGHDPLRDGQVSNAFSTAAFRFGHSMVSDTIARTGENGEDLGSLALSDAFFRPDVFAETGPEAVLRGMSGTEARALDGQIVDSLRNLVMDGPGAPRLDLAALNIERGRDHGLPTLNDARAQLGLPRLTGFDDPALRAGEGAKLSVAYDSIDDVELWVGMLAEAPVSGGLVGPTQRAVLVDQFSRMRDADPEWYEGAFSSQDVARIEGRSLADILRDTAQLNDADGDALRVGRAVV